MEEKSLANIISFYLNTNNVVFPTGYLTLNGLNEFSNTTSNLQLKWDQQSITNGFNLNSFSFAQPFDNGCKIVLISGKIFVTLGDSSVLMFPVGNVDPTTITSKGFSLTAPPYPGSSYRFDINYLAIGY